MLALTLAVLLHATPTPIAEKARAAFLDNAQVPGATTLKPGDHVDVIAVVVDPDTHLSSAQTILQNVIVVNNEAGFLSLLLLPEEASLLGLARANGQLNVTLRNPTDLGVMEERRADTLRTLLPKPKK